MGKLNETDIIIEYKGTWKEVSQFCNDVSEAIHNSSEIEDENGDINRWDDWRPREGEDNSDMKRKTVEHASSGEPYHNKPGGDVNKEVEKTKEEIKCVADDVNGSTTPTSSFKSAILQFFSLAKSVIYNKFNSFERYIYIKIIGKGDKYFDTELINASMKSINEISLEKTEDKYLVKLTFNDNETKDEVIKKLNKIGYD